MPSLPCKRQLLLNFVSLALSHAIEIIRVTHIYSINRNCYLSSYNPAKFLRPLVVHCACKHSPVGPCAWRVDMQSACHGNINHWRHQSFLLSFLSEPDIKVTGYTKTIPLRRSTIIPDGWNAAWHYHEPGRIFTTTWPCHNVNSKHRLLHWWDTLYLLALTIVWLII